MTVIVGTHLGPFEILAPLGAGGMGEVYRARDSRLGRDVAIKVLRSDVIQDGERRRRFETEARAASSLNHPNILTIHDIGSEDGAPYIVSELIEGESLRSFLRSGPPALRKLLDIAVQMADGLAAAHSAALTHRDLKPENIMIRQDGRVKILDFGLAKPAMPASTREDASTVTEVVTHAGLVLGTVPYMSPEQALGKAVDFRSDQFSFGSILYEMATGRRPFHGANTVELLSAVTREEPQPIGTLNPSIPAPLRWIIDRCLAKEADQRFASTADLYHQLRDLSEHMSEMLSSGTAPADVAPRPHRRAVSVVWGVAIVLALLATAAGIVGSRQKTVAPFQYTPFATDPIDQTDAAWSPDGKSLAYVGVVDGMGQIFTRSLDSPVPARITNAKASCQRPFWSPDGTRIYYSSQARLFSVGATGGDAQQIGEVEALAVASTITPDGRTLAYFRNLDARSALWLSSSNGENPRRYRHAPFPDHFRIGQTLRFSPDGRKLIVNAEEEVGPAGGNEFWVLPFPDGTPRRLATTLPSNINLSGFSWTADSRYVLFGAVLHPGSGSHIYSLDSESGRLRQVTSSTSDEASPAVSPDGKRIAFTSGGANLDLVQGRIDRLETSILLATSRNEFAATWAPSGRQYAYVTDAGGAPAIWLRSTEEEWSKPVVTGESEGNLSRAIPRFSPDGERLAFARMGSKHHVWISQLAGGREVPLEQESTDQHNCAWSPDGKWIAYIRFFGGQWQIAKAPSGGMGKPISLLDGGIDAGNIDWSPDGAWIAHTDNQGLYVISADGKSHKLLRKPAPSNFAFSKSGDAIYFIHRGPQRSWELASVSVPGGEESKMVSLDLPTDVAVTSFNLHPDGKHFAATIRRLKRDIWILDGF